jgi:hypothetical protein
MDIKKIDSDIEKLEKALKLIEKTENYMHFNKNVLIFNICEQINILKEKKDRQIQVLNSLK